MPSWWPHPSSSTSKSHSDDNILGGKYNLKSGIMFRRGNRQIAQGRKTRNQNENEIENSPTRTSPAYGTPPSPHPLPMPALNVLFRQHDNSSPNNNLPLPSPKDVEAIWQERAREKCPPDVNGGNRNGTGRLPILEARRSADQSVRRPDNVIYNAPFSAPASPYSSTTAPVQHICHGDASTNQHVTLPASLNVRSARDLFPSDSPGSSNQPLIEKTGFGVDSSPLESPRISPGRKSTNGSASPLPNKLPAEISTTRRESNSQSNVHPLPLPPVATTSQPAPVTHLATIPEVVPVNSQWEKGKLIGRGTFGSVYVASNRETGALCAMKEVELLADDPKSAESCNQLDQEIKVLSNLKHPNIVQYYGSEKVGDRFYIYLEYVHPGSLTKFIKDHYSGITESVVRNFTRHILSGLAYLHSTKTIHRDIKGANLLVDACGVVKLADFGMAKHLNEHRANLSLKGSPYWMAPELLKSEIETDASAEVALTADIWSLGCTIIEMLNGRPPWSEYEGAAALFKVIQESPRLPKNLSEECRDFLLCCFRRNPAERPTATMLLEHRFVKGTSQTDLPSTSGTKSRESGPTRKERPSVKADQMPATLDIKGKLADNFMNCYSPVILANNVMSKHLI